MRSVKLVLIVCALTLLVPVASRAANICVWDYDTLDRWYDPDVGDSITSAYWVDLVLEEQGHTVSVFARDLPGDLLNYDAVFCLMGWYRC